MHEKLSILFKLGDVVFEHHYVAGQPPACQARVGNGYLTSEFTVANMSKFLQFKAIEYCQKKSPSNDWEQHLKASAPTPDEALDVLFDMVIRDGSVILEYKPENEGGLLRRAPDRVLVLNKNGDWSWDECKQLKDFMSPPAGLHS